jgi:hypothetical protein
VVTTVLTPNASSVVFPIVGMAEGVKDAGKHHQKPGKRRYNSPCEDGPLTVLSGGRIDGYAGVSMAGDNYISRKRKNYHHGLDPQQNDLVQT